MPKCPKSPDGNHKALLILGTTEKPESFMEIETHDNRRYQAEFCEHCDCLFLFSLPY